MNLYVAIGATRILRILVMSWTSGFFGPHSVVHAVTRQTELVHTTEFQESWIRRAMRCVTRNASIRLERCVLVSEWPLLIGMALYASSIRACRQSCLFEFETAVRIVAIAATHGAFEHLVMGRHGELMFDFAVTVQA